MAVPDADGAFAPLVSVIIPVYNRAHLVGRAIASVIAQSYRNLEIVVVDDGSSDGLAATLAEFASAPLRCVIHPRNRGAAAARNSGVATARGEFIAFLDSDDIWFPEKLAFQVAAMRNQPREVAGHVCAYDCVKTGYGARRVVPDWTPLTFRRSQLFGCTCGPGTTLLCRRGVFAEIGPFDEEMRRLEDWDWILRLADKGYCLIGAPTVLARVEVGAGASRRDVDAALQRIRQRHHAAVARESATARRIFEATLYLESAAGAFASGARGRAFASVVRSLMHYPIRGGGFYWRLAQRAAGRLGTSRLDDTSSTENTAGQPRSDASSL